MSFVISYTLECVLYQLRSLVLYTFPFSFQACVDVRASSVFWQQMELAETVQGQPKLPEWLSTHPSHENRAEHLDRLIPEVSRVQRCVFFFQEGCQNQFGIDSQATLVLIYNLLFQHRTYLSLYPSIKFPLQSSQP